MPLYRRPTSDYLWNTVRLFKRLIRENVRDVAVSAELQVTVDIILEAQHGLSYNQAQEDTLRDIRAALGGHRPGSATAESGSLVPLAEAGGVPSGVAGTETQPQREGLAPHPEGDATSSSSDGSSRLAGDTRK